MKIICKLTDKEVLGSEGLSSKAPRLTARAILQSCDGLYAVMYTKKFDLYSLPGGGIENGEEPNIALKREIIEETGCSPAQITELGRILENRACLDYTQDNYYYFVETIGAISPPHMTEKEVTDEMEVQWHTFEDMYRLITSAKHENFQRKYVQARDTAALDAYAAWRKNETN